MALRLERAEQQAMQYTSVSALGGARTAGVGELKRVVAEDTPLAKTYKGQAGVLDFAFPATPGLRGPIRTAIMGVNAIRNTILRLEIWQDTTPIFDRYRVRVWLAGDYAIPPDGLQGTGTPTNEQLGISSVNGMAVRARGVGAIGVLPLLFIPIILVAVGALAILGAIAWKVYKTSWAGVVTGISTILLVAGGVAIAGLYVLAKGGGARASIAGGR